MIGLGPNLFYNSPMESCVVVLNCNKPAERKNKVLFINGVEHVTRERAHSRLSDDDLSVLYEAYLNPEKQNNITALVDIDVIKENCITCRFHCMCKHKVTVMHIILNMQLRHGK